MRLLTRLRSLWRGLVARERMEKELDDELAAYVEELASRKAAGGATPNEARRAALAEVGALWQVKRDVRASWLATRGDALVQDVAQAWRGLRQTPGLSVLAVATFGLGIGASSAVLGVVEATLFTPPPLRDPSRLVVIWAQLADGGHRRVPLSGPELSDLRQRTTVFDGLAATWTNQIVLTDQGEPEFVRIGLVTPDFFSVLGVEAAAGRLLSAAHEEEGGPPAILLSFAIWQRRFGADPDLVGRTIGVNEHPARVVGVLPSTFRLRLPADSGIPDGIEAYQVFPWRVAESPRGQRYLRVVGRLKPGVRLEDARHEVDRVAAELSREHGARRERVFRTVSLEAETTQEVRAPLWIVAAGAALLFAAAAVNVLAVLVARAAARRRETALRVALGAGPSRIVRLALAEGLTLAALGAGLGVMVGRALLAGLLVLQPTALRRLAEPTIDGTVVAFASVLAFAWGFLFALAPLGVSRRGDVRALLGSARVEGPRLRLGARAGFAGAQVAVTAMLLIGAGLLVRTFQHVQAIDPGFDARGVLAFRVPSAVPRSWSDEGHEELGRRLRAELSALPSVRAVGAVSHLPYDNIPNWAGPYSLVDEPEDALPSADYRSVSPGFFETARVSLREGRFFDEADGARSARVAIVDETLARRAWPGGSALGRRLKVDPGSTGSPTHWVTVVGVVGHMRHRSLLEGLAEQVYFPLAQAFRNPVAYLVRTDGHPADLTPAVRTAVQSVDPRLPIYEAEPLIGQVERARGVRRFTMVLVGTFAAASVVLASVGVYGVLAYLVVQRRREYGVRLALGATRGQIVVLVFGEGARLVAAGAAAGLAASLAAGRLLRSQLYGVGFADPPTYALALALLAAVAFVSCWFPARRAGSADVLEVLHAE